MAQVTCKWTGDMAFEAEVTGHKIVMDADSSVGGRDQGPRPKALVMASLAGCTGMDVVSILKKMRVDLESFEMKVSGELNEEHPKSYKKVNIVYEFAGKNLPQDKLKRAVELSQEKYCGVIASLRQPVQVTFEIKS
jgi:putative redox protein